MLDEELAVAEGGAEGESQKVWQGTVYANHSDFNKIQDALDFARDNDYYRIIIEPGSYDPIVLHEAQRLIGQSTARTSVLGDVAFISTTSGTPAVTTDAQAAEVYYVEATHKDGGVAFDAPYAGVSFMGCSTGGQNGTAYRLQAGENYVHECDESGHNTGVLLTSSSENCVVTSNILDSGLTDNGSGNLTTPNIIKNTPQT